MSQAEGSKVDDRGARGSIAWMASNPIAANLLMIILIGGGLFTAAAMQKEVFPEFALDIVEVRVGYPGASPEEVEQSILQPVEEAVRGVQGIREMTAMAREGSGRVSLELVAGLNRMKAFQEIDQAVNRVRHFLKMLKSPRCVCWISSAELWI